MSETGGEARKLGPFLATVIVAGNMIGSGIFLLPATLAGTGSVTILAWLIASGGALVLAGVYARLGGLRHAEGGLIGYVRDALGPHAGFQATVLYWINMVVGNVALALAVTGAAAFFFSGLKAPLAQAATTLGVIWLVSGAALLGPRTVGRLGALTLFLGIVPVALVATVGWIWFHPAILAGSWNVSGKPQLVAAGAAVAPVFWAFLGLECANAAAAVVRDPQRNVPIAVLGGVALTALLYIAAMVVIMGIAPAADLAKSTAPFGLVVARVLGPFAGGVMALCALLKTAGTLAGWMLVLGQTMRAGSDEGLLPAWFGRARADGTPVRSILFVAVVMSAIALATFQPALGKQFGVLSGVSVIASIAVYLLCAISLWRFAEALPATERRGARTLAALGAAFSLSLAGAAFVLGVDPASGLDMAGFTVAAVGATAAFWLLVRGRVRSPVAV
jgi:arginine:agmatine antiporter